MCPYRFWMMTTFSFRCKSAAFRTREAGKVFFFHFPSVAKAAFRTREAGKGKMATTLKSTLYV
jgi:hypothetical protein